MRSQRLDDCSIVDRQFGFSDEAVPNALRQKRFDISGGRRQGHGMSLGGQPLADGLQVRCVGAVDGDHQRFSRGDDVVGQPVQETAMPHRQRLQTQLEQTLLAGPALTVRGQHAAGHP